MKQRFHYANGPLNIKGQLYAKTSKNCCNQTSQRRENIMKKLLFLC